MRPSVTNKWQTRSVRHFLNSSLAFGLAGQVTFTEGVKVGLDAAIPTPSRTCAFAMLDCVRTITTRTPESEAAPFGTGSRSLEKHQLRGRWIENSLCAFQMRIAINETLKFVLATCVRFILRG